MSNESVLNKKVKNVYLSTVTTGSRLNSYLVSLALRPDEIEKEKGLYIELNTNNAHLYDLDYFDEIKQSLFFETEENKKVIEGRINFTLVKDHLDVLYREVEEYLFDLSNEGEYTLVFWINSPLDWMFFLNHFFSFKDEVPIIPEYIYPYPQDINTILNFISKDLESIDDLFAVPLNEFDSPIIRTQYLKNVFDYVKKLLSKNDIED